MASGKKHIVIDGHSTAENFASKSLSRSQKVPLRNRQQHGQHLAVQYDALIYTYQEKRAQVERPITEDLGIYSVIENQISVPVEVGV